jgi:preprotein translocase subunit Sec61beta
MKNRVLNKLAIFNDPTWRLVLTLGLMVALLIISSHVFAKDLLAGTDSDIKDTMQGTGKNWMLWIDGGISLASFAYTKKPIVFFSVLGICLFITALVKLAGA